MKFNELTDMMQKPEPKPDTYEAGMALNQLLKIGSHAIKIHNMIDDSQEMESWVAKKIDLASNYVKSVHGYTAGSKAGTYDDNGMTEMKKMPKGTGTMQGVKEAREQIGDYAREIKTGRIVRIVDYTDDDEGIYTISYGEDKGENDVTAKDLKFLDQTGVDQEEIGKFDEDAGDIENEIAKMYDTAYEYINDSSDNPSDIESDYKFGYNDDDSMEAEDLAAAFRKDLKTGMALQKQLQAQREKEGREGDWDPFNPESMYHDELKALMSKTKGESVSEDAGEGHMSKSTLYHTAKYAIALMDMIKKGDDLEGWVQSKLNKAADYLQGAYNYEEYQKLNPYREELDNNMIARHSQIIQKNIDEILDKETEVDDIDTKPGMMRILAKRVNEVEKKLAKETRKQDEGKMSDIDTDMKSMSDEDFMKKYKKSKEQMKKDLNEDGHMDVPSAIRNCETIIEDAMQMKQKLQTMEGELPSWMTQMIAVAASDLNDARDYLLNPTTESGIMYRAGVKKYGKKGMTAIQSAAGKGASHQEIGKIKDKFIKDEEQFDEGLKDWAKGLAMAGVIVAGLAGVGSIQNAIDNSVPAVQAMNKAYEMAMDAGNTELADMIKKDLSAVKVRLDSGKDLNFVKAMQEKYGKFMTTEGLAYESKLAVLLNQRIK